MLVMLAMESVGGSGWRRWPACPGLASKLERVNLNLFCFQKLF